MGVLIADGGVVDDEFACFGVEYVLVFVAFEEGGDCQGGEEEEGGQGGSGESHGVWYGFSDF